MKILIIIILDMRSKDLKMCAIKLSDLYFETEGVARLLILHMKSMDLINFAHNDMTIEAMEVGCFNRFYLYEYRGLISIKT